MSRVLVIDDNANIFDDFQAILGEAKEPSGLDAMHAELFGGEVKHVTPGRTYQLDYASQGQEGYDKVKQACMRAQPYQLAFVDMRMPPGWDGLETIERIWQVDPHVQIVLCTAYSDYSWEQMTTRLGTAPNLLILKKPFDVIEVAQLASALTEKWHLGRQATLQMEELDRKVAERTAELQRVNDRLQQEITEHAQAEQKAQWFLESAPEAMLVVNDTGQIVLVNAQAEQMFGYAREALFAQPIESLLPERFRGHHVGHRDAFFMTPQVRPMGTGLDLHALHKDGREFPVEVSLSPIEIQGEHLASCCIRDITERKRMERQLTQAQKLESIGQLAAGIAHEINTPTQFVSDNTRFLHDAFCDLTSLLASYAVLTQASKAGTVTLAHLAAVEEIAAAIDVDYLTVEIPEAIRQALEGLERIATIVRAMKEFAHPGTEEKTAIDLNKAIESTLIVARNEWKYAAEIVTDFTPDLPLVPCVPGALHQVILNLVVNAAHAITEAMQDRPEVKGTITISTRHGGDWVEVTITDTGTGIPEAVRTRVFDPFFTTKEVGKGTGQGLSIAYDVVVNKHGGTLTFESEEGQGTTFCIGLPLSNLTRTEASNMTTPGLLFGPK